uniref:Uncharacterized protein n=1 Tax=uncultured marine virus TaxID=186617 RepID=A0A0F7L3N2_9VIRU|nr:hypothetical protein [uncultured marine virus]
MNIIYRKISKRLRYMYVIFSETHNLNLSYVTVAGIAIGTNSNNSPVTEVAEIANPIAVTPFVTAVIYPLVVLAPPIFAPDAITPLAIPIREGLNKPIKTELPAPPVD